MDMTNTIIRVKEFLAINGVEFAVVPKKQRWRIQKASLGTYAGNVKATKGIYVYGGFMWNGFSSGLEKCRHGDKARQAYFAQRPSEYYIFGEGASWCFACRSDQYPDLSDCCDEAYVAHHTMDWTMVFTHEQPHIGPFFAERNV